MNDLRSDFIKAGGNPTNASFRAKEQAALDAARVKYSAYKEQAQADRPTWAIKAADIAGRGLAVVSVGFSLVLVLGGLSIGTVLLLVAEFLSVRDGYSVMTPSLAPLYSAATVTIYIALLFIRAMLENKQRRGKTFKPSLRLVLKRLWNLAGLSQPEYKPELNLIMRLDSAVGLATLTIVLLGLLGRLSTLIAPTDGQTWVNGLQQLVTTSNLRDITGLIAAPIATFMLLTSTDFVLWYIHKIFDKVTGGLDSDFLSTSSERSLETFEQEELAILYHTATSLESAIRELTAVLREKPALSSGLSINGQEMDTVETVIIDGKSYTSSKLNLVIQWLKEHPDEAHLTVRDISTRTGVSKSWVAIAKKHLLVLSET